MTRKPPEVHVIDTTPPDAARGFRVGPDELSDEQAWTAMNAGCNEMVETALKVRLDLLRTGFAAEHSLCIELDDVARRFNINREVVLRDWAANQEKP